LTLGPTPLVVRVRMQSSSVSGYVNNSVSLSVEPDSPATIAPVAGACSSILLTANPAFDGSLDLELYDTYANVPLPFQALAVLGLGAAPVQLPTPHPCLLIPTPDAVVPMQGELHLPTARLHGVPIWVQAVPFSPSFTATNSFFVLYP